MKKIFNIVICISALFIFNGCTDETLSPSPGWESGVHGFGVFDGVSEASKANIKDDAKTFPVKGQDNAKMNFKIRWVSLDNKLTVNKIEIYVRMLENYNDPEGNPKTADLSGNGKGKLVSTLSTVAANRQWNTFSITPDQIYQLYKTATVKYDGKTAVSVFNNPARPRPVGERLRIAESTTYTASPKEVSDKDTFVVTWVLYTSEGLKFETFEPNSICGDPTPVSEANANCSLTTSVK
jgi:hypothetical protein